MSDDSITKYGLGDFVREASLERDLLLDIAKYAAKLRDLDDNETISDEWVRAVDSCRACLFRAVAEWEALTDD